MTDLFNKLLTDKFKEENAVTAEIINLEAILRLPKGTEHFMSDLHGEYDAFCHLMNNCSGVIKEKIELLFGDGLSKEEKLELATTVYYPAEKIAEKREAGLLNAQWYKSTLFKMTEICRELGRKYTRRKVRKAMPEYYGNIIEEMLYNAYDNSEKAKYYDEVFGEIINLKIADDFVGAIATLIKRLSIDHLHIVGDVYDRGESPDKILDMLMSVHSLDFSWGNHDILWMGAAAGSALCVVTAIDMCLKYGNLEVLEIGYGISLRELAFFADRFDYDKKFAPRGAEGKLSESDKIIAAKMRKAIFKIMLKLEGQAIERNPDYLMENRSILKLLDVKNGTVNLDGENVKIIEPQDFADIDPRDPLRLTEEESRVKEFLIRSFKGSEKLKRHFKFLIEKGGFYTIYNNNLIFHGCVPLEDNGEFQKVMAAGKPSSGRALLDRLEHMVRRAAMVGLKEDKECAGVCSIEREKEKDIFWYLWCGKSSPLFGRNKLAAFENIYVPEAKYSVEEKNAYYVLSRNLQVAENILKEFGLGGKHSHIINGHIPVEYVKGENPIKAGGKLLVIDGGFCRAYHSKTGIAGYTLIYSSHGMRLAAHRPFMGKADAITNNADIVSDINIFEASEKRLMISDTDKGAKLREQIATLKDLLKSMRDKYSVL